MKSNEVILHGEAMVFISEIPTDAVKKVVLAPYAIIADSETTGNHHVIDVIPGVEFYESPTKTLYMKSSVETVIRCLHKERHDEITIPAGTYEFGSQQEYDPFAARLRNVAD
jgi:hypothetical protein